MKSIMQDEKRCYICGAVTGLERHHVMSGTANRKLSETYGLWIWLCYDHHRGQIGVHSDYFLKERTEKDAQRAFEAMWGHVAWMAIFRKNYL